MIYSKNIINKKLSVFSPLIRIASLLSRHYLKRTVLITIISFFVGLSETIGVLSIIPIFLILTGEEMQGEGFASIIYSYFSDLGLTDNFSTILFFFVSVLILKSLLKLLNSTLIGSTYAIIARNYRLKIMSRVNNAGWSYFVTQKTGILANAISSEPEKVANLFQYFIRLVTAIIQFSLYLFVSFAISTLITFSSFIYAFFLFIIMIYANGIIQKSVRVQVQGIKKLTGTLTEYLLLLKPIKAMQIGSVLKQMLNKETNQINKGTKKQIFVESIVQSIQEPIVAVFICLFLYLSVNVFYLNVAEIILLCLIFYRLMTNLSLMQTGYLNVVRLDKFVQSITETILRAKQNREIWNGNLSHQLKSNISFNNVTFGYRKKNKIIKNLSIKLKNKKINMICGPSGIGKTTIVDLIIGLYRPNKGEILIDNTPLDKININFWRKQIGYVSQETILLNNSILKNITLGKKYPKKHLDFAIKAAQLNEFINKLPKKINTLIGERGIMLSGGQRQRISIARALVKDPKIIILDEPTSNLDPITEKKIFNILKRISKKIMVIAISHSKEFISNTGNIFIFSNKKLIKK